MSKKHQKKTENNTISTISKQKHVKKKHQTGTTYSKDSEDEFDDNIETDRLL